MTDRELLEMAAKAAGFELTWRPWPAIAKHGERDWTEWNPLADDGDALRLAVKLHMHIQIDDDDEAVYAVYVWTASSEAIEAADPTVTDVAAATRRAIVRAAAALGESE